MMNFRKMTAIAAVFMLAGSLAACDSQSGGISGQYGQKHAGEWFTILEFKGGEEVVLTMIGSEDRFHGTYKKDGDKISVRAAGETRTLTIDSKGCLDGGNGNSFFTGVVCKK